MNCYQQDLGKKALNTDIIEYYFIDFCIRRGSKSMPFRNFVPLHV